MKDKLKDDKRFVKHRDEVKVGEIFDSHNSGKYKILSNQNGRVGILFLNTGYEGTVILSRVLLNTVVDESLPKKPKRELVCEFEYIENPYPENDLPDLNYGGCRYLGYAGGRSDNHKSPLYFFKCHCGNTFKERATNVVKKENPSCGCLKEKNRWKVSASLFENHMETWNPDTDNPLVKKLPIFKGIVGREKIIGHSLVDKDVYDVWSKIMWTQNVAGYVTANYSKDNCRRLGIKPPKNRVKLTLFLHRCVLGLSHEISYCADHINGIPLDNRSCNLRVATPQENNFNKKKLISERGSIGIKFVKDKGFRNRPWIAFIMIDRGSFQKSFKTKQEASWYRDLMAVDLHGEFASLNHPENIDEYKNNLHKLHYK